MNYIIKITVDIEKAEQLKLSLQKMIDNDELRSVLVHKFIKDAIYEIKKWENRN